jgi:hypothetical protein
VEICETLRIIPTILIFGDGTSFERMTSSMLFMTCFHARGLFCNVTRLRGWQAYGSVCRCTLLRKRSEALCEKMGRIVFIDGEIVVTLISSNVENY